MTRYYVTIKQTRTLTVPLDEVDGVRSEADTISLVAQEMQDNPDAIEDKFWDVETLFKCHTVNESAGIHSNQYD